MNPIVLGLDLSLKSPAAVLAPGCWRPGDWKALLRSTLSTTKTGPERLIEIREWLKNFLLTRGLPTHAYFEQYAFGAKGRIAQLGEGGGVVQVLLWEWFDVRCEAVVAASARSTLLGHVPSKKTSGVEVKDYVNNQLAKMGANFDTMDEGDAFVVMNHGRMLLGLSHVGVGV